MKSEKDRAKEVLKERERAEKGFAVTNDEGNDPMKKQDTRQERQEKVGDAGLAVGIGMKRR